ncbi:MAG: hypothetical protein KGJ79_16340 [Alphaproteobacteria bacterium]|nr:hypothetical protein [Alphaproteobacteria bacterium]MDE2112711.1 hypothetical protein [Alphaproteobacteria bacterium]MDE2495255.1 hypothetical protein [Alphaproteobacteria bacterium]
MAAAHIPSAKEKAADMARKNTRDQGAEARISDHLHNYKIVQQHIQHHTIDELQFYPEHDQRTESPEYKRVHRRLTVELDLPCLVCGVRQSTLKTPAENRYEAKAMETHHHMVEWALANAIDVGKFNKTLRPNLAHRHPNDPTWHYERPFDEAKIRAWVDHSEHNLWVLCDVHHRAKYLGIHEITYPIWAPMDLYRDDFKQWAREQLADIRKGRTPG